MGEKPPLDSAGGKPRSKSAPSQVRFNETAPDDAELARTAELCREFVAETAVISRAEAAKARHLAELHQLVLDRTQVESEISIGLRSKAADLALAAGLNDRALLRQLGEAHLLVHDYPVTLEALEQASITMQHVRVITDEGEIVEPAKRGEYEAECVAVAAETSPARLRDAAKRVAQRLTAHTIDELHHHAAAKRSVSIFNRPHGMAELVAVLPATLAYGIYDRLHQGARAAHKLDEEEAEARGASKDSSVSTRQRQLGQYRADIFTELLLTGSLDGASAHGASDLPTSAGALGNTDEPGSPEEQLNSMATSNAPLAESEGIETSPKRRTSTRRALTGIQARVTIIIPAGGTATLEGYGPIDSATARAFAAAAPGWDTTTLSLDGHLLTTEKRHPSEAMRRILQTRDAHCRFPGCMRPTQECQIDHTIEWARNGPTSIVNLGHLCPLHHALKHPDLPLQSRWSVTQDSAGVLMWTGPIGATYIDRPEHPFNCGGPAGP